MKLRSPALAISAAAAGVLASSDAAAGVQKFAFDFDPNLSPNPTQVASAITQGEMSLPPLPVAELTMLTTDAATMKLWFWPENAALLTGIAQAGTTPMTWPSTPVMCAKHAAFTIPTLLVPGASGSCTSADAQIRQSLANLSACILVEQPELYVYGYRPTDARSDVGDLEHMIGLAGEALTHAGPPPAGVLPSDFVPTLRAVVDKLRHDALVSGIAQAKTSYANAVSLANANASCFDATAKAQLVSGLGDLATELDAAKAHLDTLKSTGEATNQHENICLASHSRVRNALPYPSLTQRERELTAFWLGAIYWRMRGGGLIPLGSTQDARTYFLHDAFTHIGELVGGQDGADTAGPFYTEVIFDGWAQWQDMGMVAGRDKYSEIVSMSERGQRQAQAGINVIGPRGYDTSALMTGGLQMGPGYYYAYYPLKDFRYASPLAMPYSGFIDWATAIGELNIGGALALGLARSLLAGKATGMPPTVNLCAGRACGDDGCGGACGTCAAGLTCSAGQCVDADGGVAVDAGGDAGADAGRRADSGVGAGADADAEGDGGTPNADAPGGSAGCACTASDTSRAPNAIGIAAAGVVFAVASRRKKRTDKKLRAR